MASKAQAPRSHTPDHPPYAVMIGEAIRSLAEEGGSTEAAISQYIKSNYDDLPWGHDRLLPYYLNKLTIFGEVSVGGPGRYLVVEDSTAEPALASKETVHEGDVVKPLKSLPPPLEAHLGEKSLPVLELELSAHEGNAGEQFHSVATLREPEAIAAKDDGSCSSPLPKRRGRRPRRKLNSSETKEVQAEDDQGTSRPIPAKAATIESEGDGSLLSIPPSEPRNIEGDATWPPECLAALSIKAQDAGLSDLLFHKGNVEKQLGSLTSKDGQDCTLPVPRRRGRPPKRKTTATKIKLLCRDALLQPMPPTMETGRDGSLSSSLPSEAIDFKGFVIEPSKSLSPSSNKDCNAEKSLQPLPTDAKMANEVMLFILSKPLAQEGSVKERLESLATNGGGLASSSVYKRRIRHPKRKTNNPNDCSELALDSKKIAENQVQNGPSVSIPIANHRDGSSLQMPSSEPMSTQANVVVPLKSLAPAPAATKHNSEKRMPLLSSEPLPQEGDAVKQMESLGTKDSENGSMSVIKHCRRPPKRKIFSDASAEVGFNSKHMGKNGTETNKCHGTSRSKPLRRTRSSSVLMPVTEMDPLLHTKLTTIESSRDGSSTCINHSQPMDIERNVVEPSMTLPPQPPSTKVHCNKEIMLLPLSETSAHDNEAVETIVPLTIKDADGGSMPTPKRRGRLPKGKPVDHVDALLQPEPTTLECTADSSTTLLPQSEPDMVELPNTILASCTNALSSVEEISLVTSEPSVQDEKVVEHSQSLTTKGSGGGFVQVRKRRGRPPKSKPNPTESSEKGLASKQIVKGCNESGQGELRSLASRKTKGPSVSVPITNVDPLLQAKATSIENAGNGSLSSTLPSKPMNLEGNLAEPSKILSHSKPCDEEDSISLALADPSADKDDVGEPFQSLTTKDGSTTSLPAPKRRGRPPKRKPNHAFGREVRLNSKQVAVQPIETQNNDDGSSSQPTGDQGGAAP